MNRYFFYNYFIVCFTNLMLLIPYYLTVDRYNGAVMSIILSPIFGYLFLYMFTSSLSKFPGKGLPEIFALFYPKWVVNITMAYKAILIGIAGAIVVSTYAVIITSFLNPDANEYIMLMLLMIICAYAATRSTVSIAFILEISLLLSIPVIAFVMYKTIKNPLMNWDAIHVIVNHIGHLPTLISFAAASFVFTGYLNMGLFNRILPPNFKFRYIWSYPIIVFIILLISFFVPIGIHGTETVAHYVFLWSATADSTRMMYGFIERVLFVFLIVLINLSLTFTMVGWHMVIEYIRTIIPNNVVNPNETKTPLRSYIIAGCIMVVTFLAALKINDDIMVKFTAYFLIYRMFSEMITTTWIFILSRKKVRKYEKNTAS
ncbi:MAG TPA: GerAB/ArcD/ProY family transporter [Candidatus Paenibacillus intestinavium]|nr:GerAB/ArcD/ProY family transporter [Candidatus Paenibacillus intestinavium]